MKKSKITSLVLAGALMLTAMLTGTLAWQAISQEALNEKITTVNAGGRLHDDFNGTNKDIYVENFTDPLDNGAPIYARIRLDEYMEVGEDAGEKLGDPEREATSKIEGAKIDDKTTWSTYIPDQNNLMEPAEGNLNQAFRDYWTWTMGQNESKYYMPTFNKDKDNLDADINGTFAGDDGKRDEGRPYDDYVVYGVANGETKTKKDTAVYDAASGSGQEETHEVKQTQSGTVITMQQWMSDEYDSKPGNYWVYDTDGWAYWANPIMPGEATGLLLTAIGARKDPGTTSYYAINVVAQFASAWDWGTPKEGEEAGTGFYTDSLTKEAEELLKIIVDAVPTVTVTNKNIATNAENVTAAYVGDQVQFEAKVMVGVEEDKDAQITWMVVDENGDEFTDTPASGETLVDSEGEGADGTETAITTINETGLLTIAEDADGQTITVIAQSAGAVERWNLYVGSLEAINITEANSTAKVLPKNACTLKFSAEAVLGGGVGSIKMEEGEVFWTLTIEDADGKEVTEDMATAINPATGVLSISNNLEEDTVLTITATTARGKTISGEYQITVQSGADAARDTVDAKEEGETVAIDNREWYVLVKNEDKALLWMTDIESAFGGGNGLGAFDADSNVWEGSDVQIWLNGTFLDSLQTLKGMAQYTTFKTRSTYNGPDFTESTDKVFLFSEADIFGTQNSGTAKPDDYTYNGEQLKMITDTMKTSSNQSWLRSPGGSSSGVASLGAFGTSNTLGYDIYVGTSGHGVRPALWVSLK